MQPCVKFVSSCGWPRIRAWPCLVVDLIPCPALHLCQAAAGRGFHTQPCVKSVPGRGFNAQLCVVVAVVGVVLFLLLLLLLFFVVASSAYFLILAGIENRHMSRYAPAHAHA